MEDVNLKRKKKGNLFGFLFIPEEVEENLYKTWYCCTEYCWVFWEEWRASFSVTAGNNVYLVYSKAWITSFLPQIVPEQKCITCLPVSI